MPIEHKLQAVASETNSNKKLLKSLNALADTIEHSDSEIAKLIKASIKLYAKNNNINSLIAIIEMTENVIHSENSVA